MNPNLESEIKDWFFTEDTRSVLIYPLMVGQECIGALNLYSRKLRAFAPRDLRIAREIADKVALGVQSARLFASTRRFADEQAALLNVSQAVVSGQDLQATLLTVAQSTVGVAGAEGVKSSYTTKQPIRSNTSRIATRKAGTRPNSPGRCRATQLPSGRRRYGRCASACRSVSPPTTRRSIPANGVALRRTAFTACSSCR